MIDSLIKERCNRLVEVMLTERRKQLKEEMHQIDAEAAAKGMYGSGNRLMQLHKLLSRELEIRTILSWESMVRVHRLLGSPRTGSLARDFKEEMALHVQQAYDELSSALEHVLKNAPPNVTLSLDDTRSLSIAKHNIEIDLYADSLPKTTEASIGSPALGQQYNFYGNVGAVQTGASSSVNIVQNLGAEDRQALISALGLVREQLSIIQGMTENKRGELREIVEECIQQSSSQNPNNTKLLTLLNILGVTVQSFASAQPAYLALKTALMPLGIMLP